MSTAADAARATATFAEAIRHGLEDAMAADDTVVVLGQDVVVGFPFGITRGLAERFGKHRVRDTPISEAATMGCGTGAALHGLRPVVEVDFGGFLMLGLDQLVNNAAKLRYMSGGQLRIPLVVRLGQGPLGGFGAQHSTVQHGWLANVPGLSVCTPSTPQEAYDLMRWALRQSDPVVFAEDLRLYRAKGPLRRHEDEIALGARIARPGRDATAIVFGHAVSDALDASEVLSEDGIELEVLDLRAVAPLDVDAIGDSVRRTGRAICLSDDPLLGGFSATLAAVADDQAHEVLRAPIARLGARHAPAPYNQTLERRLFPSADSIVTAVRELVQWSD